jgi:hypothetical protein
MNMLATQFQVGKVYQIRHKGEFKQVKIERVHPEYILVLDLFRNVYRTYRLENVEPHNLGG